MDNSPQYDISQEELALIDDYLHGRLNMPQRQLFEERLKIDALLQLKVEEVKNLTAGITEVSIENQLKGFHEAMDLQESPSAIGHHKTYSLYRRWFAVAAVLAIIAVASWLFWPRVSSNERLYRAYFVKDIGFPVAMGSADSSSYAFYDGMISYKEEKYPEAIRKWEALAKSSGYSDTLRYYIGMAWLNTGESLKAETILTPLVDSSSLAFRDNATWYLALIRLKNGDRIAAGNYLKKLPDREEAKKLLSVIGL